MIRYVLVVAFSCVSGSFLSQHSYGENVLEFTSTNDEGTAWNEGSALLPKNVLPLSYNLAVATDLDGFTYSGKVTKVEVIDQMSNDPLTVDDYYLVYKNENLIIVLNRSSGLIPFRLYVVKITFEASLRDDLHGFYRSSYKEDNVTKWLAVTKFAPTHARKAFPCFDEPWIKVPFNISLRRQSDQISLSNMPLLKSTKIHQTNMFWDHFQETPPISTYLVAFFVGEFYTLKQSKIGVYTHRNSVSQTEYIANKSPILLEAMENYTRVNYTLPKLDFLAIPDFLSSAMENWGLITYREVFLLLSDNSKTKFKENGMLVVQHELSHQWFGNLVTCMWWGDLWLNEGFATFFKYFATNMVEPNWRLDEVFIYEIHQVALSVDQYRTHPISMYVETPNQILSMFDNISYKKAAAVIRMLLNTVTEKNFKNALNLYLENNKYQSTTPQDLWTAFENVLHDDRFELGDSISITQFMQSWIDQPGYPLVTIVRKNNTFIITQEQFLVQPSDIRQSMDWIIGLTYTTENRKDFNGILNKTWLKENITVLPNQPETGWYIFNLQSIGFFRVTYEIDNWNALINQLYDDKNVIHVLNRVQLIDDMFNLALADKIDYTLVLKLSKYLKKENDVIPWYSAKNGFDFLMKRMKYSPHYYKYFKTYVSHLAEYIYTKMDDLVVNYNITDHSILTGWNEFSIWSCRLDSQICIKRALSYFDIWRQGIDIPADIKDVAFCIGVKQGDSEVWNIILDVYVNSESLSERQSALSALSCSIDIIQLTKYLNYIFEGHNSPIRPEDSKSIYEAIASSSEGIWAMTDFLITNIDRIVNEVTNGPKIAKSIYGILASRVVSEEEVSKINELRNNSSIPEYLRSIFDESYNKIKENIIWTNKYQIEIGEWSKTTVLELGLDFISDEPIGNRFTTHSVMSPKTSIMAPSIQTPLPLNESIIVQAILFILMIVLN